MTNRRAKAAATATVLGLGALGGVAMATNQGLPAQVGGAKTASVVTGASSAGATTSATGASASGSTHRPIVTRASGGAGSLAPTDD